MRPNRKTASLLLGILLSSLSLLGAHPDYKAKWIWYPERFLDAVHSSRWFHRSFELKRLPVRAALICRADDAHTVSLNGTPVKPQKNKVVSDGQTWEKLDRYNLLPILKTGTNHLQIRVDNGTGSAGLLGKVKFTYADDSIEEFFTDGSWTASKTEQDAGVPSRVLGFAGIAPWGEADYSAFLAQDELATYQAFRQDLDQKQAALVEQLKREPYRKHSILYRNGVPFISADGQEIPAFFYKNLHLSPDDPKLIRKVQAFHDGGSRVFTVDVDLKKYWTPKGVFSQELQDLILRLLTRFPDSKILLGLNLNNPNWFMKEHPEALIRYATGPVDTKTDVFKRYQQCSYASEIFRENITKAISEFCRQLYESPVGKRIAGIRIGYGIFNEWHCFGMKADMPDVSPAMGRAFHAYLKKKYRTEAALRKAWKNDTVTFDNAPMPGVAERSATDLGELRDPDAQRPLLDYLDAYHDTLADFVMLVNRSAKEAMDNKVLLGNYYGYFFGMGYPSEGWHRRTEKVLDSPFVDFHISPYPYPKQFRAIGGFPQIRAVADTYRLRNKLLIFEDDTRTHLNETNTCIFADDLPDSISLLLRNTMHTLCHGSGIWYLDFGHNWYDCPELLDLFRTMGKMYNSGMDCSSLSEVAVICDFDAATFMQKGDRASSALYEIINGTARELIYSGIAFDSLLLSDLERSGCPEYKVYLFPGLIAMTPEKMKIIQKLKRDGHTLIFFYGAGCLNETGLDMAQMKAVTGMEVKLHKDPAAVWIDWQKPWNSGTEKQKPYRTQLAPWFSIPQQPDLTVLGTMRYAKKRETSAAMLQTKDYNTILLCAPCPDRNFYRALWKQLGVKIYSDSNDDVLSICRSLISLHTAKGGQRIVTLPPGTVRAELLFPEKKPLAIRNGKVELTLLPRSTTVIRCYQK